jgi:hypothetical protein
MSKNSTAVDSSTRKPNQKKDDEPDDYIIGPDKFPITQGRWGYMPVDVQKLLNEVNIDCQVNRASDNPCMLRHGVENNQNQSFIACVSDFMFWGRKRIVGDKSELIKVPPRIRDMKQKILKHGLRSSKELRLKIKMIYWLAMNIGQSITRKSHDFYLP